MSWFNRHIIGSLSPRWALARERYLNGLNAYYEATEPSRLRKNRSGSSSANTVGDRSAVKLRDMARHMEENLDIASGALDVLVGNVVGPGILPEPLVETMDREPAEEVNQALSRLWDDWIHAPEVTRQFDAYTLQRLVAREWLRDGEGLGQKLIGRVSGLQHGTVLPYSIEAFESDFLPFDLDDASKKIRQGVELNRWGRPVAFHMYKTHPGESFTWGGTPKFETHRHDASRILHVKMVKRLHQVRGVTIFAPAINRLDDIKEIDESERVAARVAAAMAGYIKKGTPDLYAAPELETDGTRKYREMDLVPGVIFDDLQPGEDIGTIASNRPNNELIPFRDSQLRSAASGLMSSYSSLSKNYNGTYSAQRQELVEQFSIYRALSGQFVYRWCQPVWDGFIDAVIASGAVALPANIDRSTLYNVSHTAPPMPWIDPKKEVEAFVLAEENQYESKSGIIRKRGSNPDQVYREIQRDKKDRERRGLTSEPEEEDDIEPDTSARSVYRFTQRSV